MGSLKSRTIESFQRFFEFVHAFFTSLNVFVCDRNCAQTQALLRAFGSRVKIVYCSIHISRNIARNTGPNSTLLKSFWRMRRERSFSSEECFMKTLLQMHERKHTVFSAALINAKDSFLPSKVDAFITVPLFPSLSRLRQLDLSVFDIETEDRRSAVGVHQMLQRVCAAGDDDVLRDNTNPIEGHFSVIKKRMKVKTSTLVDIYNAVDFTERSTIASRNPAHVLLPKQLEERVASFIAPAVYSVMTREGLDAFFGLLVETCLVIENGTDCTSTEMAMIIEVLRNKTRIARFAWMPASWIIPTVQH